MWHWVVVAIAVLYPALGVAQLLEHPYHTNVGIEQTAREYSSQGMIRRAHEQLRRIKPRGFDLSTDLVPPISSHIERASGNAARADRVMETFIRSRKNSPAIPIAWMERALAAVEDGNDEASIDLFEQAAGAALIDAERRSDTTYRTIAHIARFWQGASLARTGRHAEALSALADVPAIDSNGAYADHALYAMGQLYERSRQFDSAIAIFRLSRYRYPTGPVAIATRIREAQCHMVLRRPERATDALIGIDTLVARHQRADTALQAAQRFAETSFEDVAILRMDIAVLRGLYAEAAQQGTAFLARNPASASRLHVQLQLGVALLQTGRYSEAIGAFDEVISASTEIQLQLRQQAILYRAVALRQIGSADEAQAVFMALGNQLDFPYQAQAMVEVGQAAYETGDMAKARTWLERAERASSDVQTTVRAQLLLGAALIESQQWQKAAEAFDRAEQRIVAAQPALLPNRLRYLAESRLKRGIALVQTTQTQSAIVALTDFLGNHPNDPRRDEATFWLAEAMYRRDLLTNAQELYEEVLQRYTSSIRREEAMYGLAWTYFRRRDFDRSTATFGLLLKNYPQSRYAVEAMARRGDGFYIKQQWRSAAEAYEEAARRGLKTEDGQYAAYQAAQASYRGSELEEAKRLARAFIQNYPSSRLADAAFYLLGWVHFQQDQFSEAIADLRKLIELYPTGDMAVRALYTIADAQFNMGDVEPSMETYRAVIHRYPSHPLAAEAAKSMQVALLGLNRVDEALAVADTFVRANPMSSAAEAFTFRKAEILYSGKNYGSAAAELQAYLQKYPSAERQDEALYLLGKTFLNARDVEQATAAFRELRKRFPRSTYVPQGMLDLAAALFEGANKRAADSIYSDVLKSFPEDTSAASRAGFERGVLLRSSSDTLGAVAQFLKIADTYPDTEFGDQARFQVGLFHRRTRRLDSMRYHFEILGTRSEAPLLAAHALYLVGESDVREKNYTQAIIAFDKVRNDYAGYEDWYTLAMLGLGECYEQIADKERALEVYGVVAALRPDDDYGKAAQARVKRLERKR